MNILFTSFYEFLHLNTCFYADLTEEQKRADVKKGSKLGTMQLLRSGKVFLTLNDGRKFEV